MRDIRAHICRDRDSDINKYGPMLANWEVLMYVVFYRRVVFIHIYRSKCEIWGVSLIPSGGAGTCSVF